MLYAFFGRCNMLYEESLLPNHPIDVHPLSWGISATSSVSATRSPWISRWMWRWKRWATGRSNRF